MVALRDEAEKLECRELFLQQLGGDRPASRSKGMSDGGDDKIPPLRGTGRPAGGCVASQGSR